MERMLARNLETLEQFLQNPKEGNERSTKGFIMSIFSFCFDAFVQITKSNEGLKYDLKGFENLKAFLEKYPTRDIDTINLDEIILVAQALLKDKPELEEFFKQTKRTNNAKYEMF